MRGVGMDLPYRQRFQFLLELIYGDTFKPKAFWARHPDPDEFFYALFRVAKQTHRKITRKEIGIIII